MKHRHTSGAFATLARTPAVLVIVVLICLGASPLMGAQVIRFATLAPEGSTWMKAMHSLDDEVRAATGGELGFKFYPNMSMGDERDVLRKMRLGQIQGAGFTGFGLGEILPEVRILELPYLFETDDEIDTVTAILTERLAAGFSERGFVLLGWADVGAIYFFANKPVCEPKDLNGLKVWAWEGDPLAKAFFEELGQSPVPLSVADVHLSLQTGMVNAVYCSPLAALVLQWFTKVKYVSDVPFTNSIGAVLLDKRTFDQLSPEHQRVLLEASRRNLRQLVLRTRKDNREAYEELLRQGLVKVQSTPAQRGQMRAIGVRVQNRLAGKLYPPELLHKLRQVLVEYRHGTSGVPGGETE